jgi:hypothetical protein
MGLYPFRASGSASTATVFDDVVIDQDRFSSVVDKSGKNQVAIDIDLVEGGGGPFDGAGDILVLAGDNPNLVEADAMPIPRWPVLADGTVKLELNTAYPYIRLMYNYSSGGADDTITASITVS